MTQAPMGIVPYTKRTVHRSVLNLIRNKNSFVEKARFLYDITE